MVGKFFKGNVLVMHLRLVHSYWLSRSIESKTPSSTTFYENSPLDRTFGAFWSWHDLACLDAIGRLGI